MRKKLTLEERREKIKNCGKARKFKRQNDTAWTSTVEYCGYHSGEERCEKCRSYRASVLAAQVTKNLMSADNLFRCVINDELDWKRIQQKLTREKVTFHRQPQADGTAIIITTKDPHHKDFSFVEVNALDAVAELTTVNALFTEDAGKIRSSSRDWPLTPQNAEQNEGEGVWLKTFEPRFKPSKTGDEFKTPFEELFRLLPQCNTWTYGDPVDNPQLYLTVNSSTLFEMGIAVGYEPDLDKTVVEERFYTFDEIKRWKVQSYEVTNRKFYGETEFGEAYDKHNFYGRHEQLAAVVHGNTEIPDWLDAVEKYKAEQTEQHKATKLVKEYVDVYQENDALFETMNGKEKLLYVKEIIEMVTTYREFGEEFFLTLYSEDDLKLVQVMQ